jgi:hypothetical protein
MEKLPAQVSRDWAFNYSDHHEKAAFTYTINMALPDMPVRLPLPGYFIPHSQHTFHAKRD